MIHGIIEIGILDKVGGFEILLSIKSDLIRNFAAYVG